MQTSPRHWFPDKRYGYGWGLPRTWEGWLVVVAYLTAIVTAAVLLPDQGGPLTLVTAFVATPVLVWVCSNKGEPLSGSR